MLHYFSQRTPQDPYTLENLRPYSSDFKNLQKCVRTLLLSSSSWFCIPISQSSFSSCSFCKSRRIFIIWSCKQKDTSCFHTFDKCSTCAHSLISISQAVVWFSNILILINWYSWSTKYDFLHICILTIDQILSIHKVDRLREAIPREKCSFFEHCSKGLWPPPPFIWTFVLFCRGCF